MHNYARKLNSVQKYFALSKKPPPLFNNLCIILNRFFSFCNLKVLALEKYPLLDVKNYEHTVMPKNEKKKNRRLTSVAYAPSGRDREGDCAVVSRWKREIVRWWRGGKGKSCGGGGRIGECTFKALAGKGICGGKIIFYRRVFG